MRALILSILLMSVAACTTSVTTSYLEPFINETGKLKGDIFAGAGWGLNDGVITPAPTEDMTYLFGTESYDNFVLTLEFFPVGNVNSGVFIRCQPGMGINPKNCYEINIWDDHPDQEKRTGAIVGAALPLEKISTVGKWNTCEITADAESITVRMNGVVTAVHEGNKLASGFLALQRANAATIQFRNIRLEPLE